MKTSKAVFLSFIVGAAFCGMDSVAKSLITIQEFPETYADASFAQRIENDTAGYDEWDSVYDENGNCISNCAYYGITLQEELDMMADAGAQLADDLAAEEQRGGASSGAGTGGSGTIPGSSAGAGGGTGGTGTGAGGAGVVLGSGGGTGGSGTIPGSSAGAGGGAGGTGSAPGAGGAGVVPSAGIDAGSDGTYTCKTGKYSEYANGSGFISPLDRDLVVTSVVGLRKVTGGSRVHRGIDLRAQKGTPLYAAFQGEVVHADWSAKGAGGGQYVKIKHKINGRTYYTFYMHMNEIKVAKGDRIAKGCFIGYSGRSGNNGINSTSPHLHYEIRTINDIAIDPLGSCIVKETPNLVPRELAGLDKKSKKRFESLQSGNAIHTGKNFLSRPYCLRKWQTSPVVKACAYGNINVFQCFPGSSGWCP